MKLWHLHEASLGQSLMSIVLVDSNVVLDVADKGSTWHEWSLHTLEYLEYENSLIINPVVYSEISIGYETIEDLATFIACCGFEFIDIPKEALFLAGKVFLNYRKNKGTKTNVLPDFFIGAHAAVQGLLLLTRDTRRYSTYFPKLNLITPETH